nr:AAA family ATPase [uncultured Tyzzerella sp.]
MAKVIGIMGESGSGKTTSMQNLDPKTTFYIDADKKGLSWKGWRGHYSTESLNYIKSDDARLILNILKQIDKGIIKLRDGSPKDMKHIKTIVVDTLNGIMVADEMRRCKEKCYDKWQDLE